MTMLPGIQTVISKTELMAQVRKGLAHEAFQHSTEGAFDVTLMRERAIRDKQDIVLIEIDTVLDHIHQNSDHEPARVAALTEAEWRHDPAMVLDMEDGTYLLVDGRHRILRRHQEGLTDFGAWIIPISQAIRPAAGWFTNALPWGQKEIANGKLVKRRKGK